MEKKLQTVIDSINSLDSEVREQALERLKNQRLCSLENF